LASLIVALLAFVLLFFLDRLVDLPSFNDYITFGIKIFYRAVLFLVVFWFYWKPKSLWVRGLLYKAGI
jgi:hypothetical protein